MAQGLRDVSTMSDSTRDLLQRVRDDCGYSELHSASEDGDVETVQTFLESADGRCALNGVQAGKRTALQLAVRENHVPVVDKLLDAGADVNFRSSSDGRYALHIAAGEGNNTMVNLLLEAGADKDAKSGKNDKTPVVEAIENGHFAVVETLLSKGADVYTYQSYCPKDRREMDAIGVAALRGDNDIMVALLGKEDNVEGEDIYLEYPLILACRQGHFATAKTLLKYGAPVKDTQWEVDQPLICAAEGGYDAIVTLLLENGAEPNDCRMDGESPLTMAAFRGYLRITKALLNAGAEHERALYRAFEGGNIHVIKAILDSGAEVDRQELGKHLHRVQSDAPEYMYEESRMLLLRGAPVNIALYGGKTPLRQQMDSRNCSEAVVDLLLRWGADETIKDKHGRTPADVLAKNSRLAPAVAERVRQLLDNAPRDRAWRRRGWLVMLRGRTLKAGEAGVKPEPEKSGCGGGSGGQEARLVDFVIRLEEEGVFRQVVAFL